MCKAPARATLVLLLSLLSLPATAQSVTRTVGDSARVEMSITVTPARIAYSLPSRTADVSRDLLDVVPLPGTYQWVAEDIALLLMRTGLDEWPEMAPDSLATALEDLIEAYHDAQATIEQQAEAIREHEQAYARQASQLQASMQHVGQLSSQLTAERSRAGALADTVASLRSRLAEALEAPHVEDRSGEIEQLEARVEELEARVEELEATIRERDRAARRFVQMIAEALGLEE